MPVAEELVIRVVTAVPTADRGEVGHELDPGQPLDLLDAELDFVAEPQRGAVPVAQRLDQVHDRRHGDAAPLGHAGPALDAIVLRDLLMTRQRA